MTQQSPSVQETGGPRSAQSPDRSWRDRRMEQDAMYFSRRAREERQAHLKADCRRCRQIHLELAEAYEFRAHLMTSAVRRIATDDAVSAL